MRSFSISSSREYDPCCWFGLDALAAAAASWTSARSRSSESSFVPFGVPDDGLTSGASTEIDMSLPVGTFSLPEGLTRGGRVTWALPLVVTSSGASELLREVVDGRGRFWPAFCGGTDFDGGAGGAF